MDPHGDMAGTDPIVDQGMSPSSGIPLGHIVSPQLELQRSGHAVVSLELIVPRLLPVLMEVDEAGRYDQSTRLDGLLTCERISGNRSNFPATNSHIANAVKSRLRIHDTSVRKHYVIRFPVGRCAREQPEQRQYGQRSDSA